MHCLNCGIEAMAGAAYCPSCGKPVGDPAAIEQPATAAGLQTNVAGALCYLGGFVTGILFLIIWPYTRERFVRFHAFQSIFLSAALFVAYFGLHVVVRCCPASCGGWSGCCRH